MDLAVVPLEAAMAMAEDDRADMYQRLADNGRAEGYRDWYLKHANAARAKALELWALAEAK